MSKIFISWSKEKSRDLAIEIKSLLESLDPHSKVFMSENDISAGEPVQKKSFKRLQSVIYYYFVLQKKIKNRHGCFMRLGLQTV